MERKIIISAKPNCTICGKPMLEWNPFGEVHEHPECIAERVSEALMDIVRESFDKTSDRHAMAHCETIARYGNPHF